MPFCIDRVISSYNLVMPLRVVSVFAVAHPVTPFWAKKYRLYRLVYISVVPYIKNFTYFVPVLRDLCHVPTVRRLTAVHWRCDGKWTWGPFSTSFQYNYSLEWNASCGALVAKVIGLCVQHYKTSHTCLLYTLIHVHHERRPPNWQ